MNAIRQRQGAIARKVMRAKPASSASAESSMRSGTSVQIKAARTDLSGYNFCQHGAIERELAYVSSAARPRFGAAPAGWS